MIRQLLLASRPVSWINTAYPFAAAYLLTTGRLDATLIVGTLFFLVPYNLAMYGINDVFDYESDLANPRKGGVEGIVLDRRLHRATLWAAALTCLPFVVVLVAAGWQSGCCAHRAPERTPMRVIRLSAADGDTLAAALTDYRDLTDVALRRVTEPAEGLYIAESAKVIARAIAAGHVPRSVLLQERWLGDIEPLL